MKALIIILIIIAAYLIIYYPLKRSVATVPFFQLIFTPLLKLESHFYENRTKADLEGAWTDRETKQTILINFNKDGDIFVDGSFFDSKDFDLGDWCFLHEAAQTPPPDIWRKSPGFILSFSEPDGNFQFSIKRADIGIKMTVFNRIHQTVISEFEFAHRKRQ